MGNITAYVVSVWSMWNDNENIINENIISWQENSRSHDEAFRLLRQV